MVFLLFLLLLSSKPANFLHYRCGIDVHKDSLTASLILSRDKGKEEIEVREFGTFTDELYKLKEWLLMNDYPVVAMESTGVYWYPVYNILEGDVKVLLYLILKTIAS